MPEGVVYRREGPDEQMRVGQILCGNGDIISFFNTKDLKDGEPIIFDIIRTKLKLRVTIDGTSYNYKGKVPVGIIPEDFTASDDESAKWSSNLQDRWKKEWAKYKDDEEIKQRFGGKLKTSVKNHPHCN